MAELLKTIAGPDAGCAAEDEGAFRKTVGYGVPFVHGNVGHREDRLGGTDAFVRFPDVDGFCLLKAFGLGRIGEKIIHGRVSSLADRFHDLSMKFRRNEVNSIQSFDTQ